MNFIRLTDLDLAAKRVLIRVDMNVPIKNGVITDDTRIRSSLPSIQYCLQQGAAVILMSHLGRPIEGEAKAKYSLAPVAIRLSELLGVTVPLIQQWEDGLSLNPNQIVMLENVRLNFGEKKNQASLGESYAKLCDIFVNDAFGTAHRAEASTHAVAQFAKISCAGILLNAELESLGKALENPARPLVAIVSGSKVSSKLNILDSLADKVDQLIVGGGIANTFLLASGYNIGSSLAEVDLISEAQKVCKKIKDSGGNLPLPDDVVVATEFSDSATPILKSVSDINEQEMILDIGPQSAEKIVKIIAEAGTIVWNGPLGVFEFDSFSNGTEAVAKAIAKSSAFSIAGGGDTIAAIAKFGITEQIGYISTGGGAFLEFLEGKPLPAVEILKQRAKEKDYEKFRKNIL